MCPLRNRCRRRRNRTHSNLGRNGDSQFYEGDDSRVVSVGFGGERDGTSGLSIAYAEKYPQADVHFAAPKAC